jgi:2-hydroxychromene-2-carboxylate isomerase
MADVTFSFDPGCPWTWRASRWLVEVADQVGLDIEWASFSLAIINEGKIPEQYRTRMESGIRTLRLVEALRAEGRQADLARLYTELGTRLYEAGADFDRAVIVDAARAAGVTDRLDALDDDGLDASVRASHDAAYAAAGPDIGSPVIEITGHDRGLHGPIISEVVRGKDAVTMWDAISALLATPAFFEVKRGRG